MSNINRELFLNKLESTQPGLNVRHGDRIEQADSFIFINGSIQTFSEEIACRIPSTLDKSISGAVNAEPLLNICRKLAEEEIGISAENGELILTGKRRSTGITMDHEISKELLGVQEKLGEEIAKAAWKPLHAEFGDAVAMVQQNCTKDQSIFWQVCVHIHPKWIESANPGSICRWRLPTGFDKPFLVRQSAIKHVTALGMAEFAESEVWVHFRNKNKLVLSCRRYAGEAVEFPKLSEHLKVDGESIQLPKALVEESERAAIFSKDNAESNLILVELRPGKVRIKGQGVRGWYRWSKKVNYAGKPLSFLVDPELLADLVKRHSEAVLSKERLKIESTDGKYSFVAVLTMPKVEKEEEAEGSEKEAR